MEAEQEFFELGGLTIYRSDIANYPWICVTVLFLMAGFLLFAYPKKDDAVAWMQAHPCRSLVFIIPMYLTVGASVSLALQNLKDADASDGAVASAGNDKMATVKFEDPADGSECSLHPERKYAGLIVFL